jgi:hypothetical protein
MAFLLPTANPGGGIYIGVISAMVPLRRKKDKDKGRRSVKSATYGQGGGCPPPARQPKREPAVLFCTPRQRRFFLRKRHAPVVLASLQARYTLRGPVACTCGAPSRVGGRALAVLLNRRGVVVRTDKRTVLVNSPSHWGMLGVHIF